MLKKNNHTHKTIFMRFGNLPTFTELQGFHYYQEKIQSVAIQFFLSLKNYTDKTLITKVVFSISYVVHERNGLWWTKPQKISH